MKKQNDLNKKLSNKTYTDYPKFIKMTNLYIMYEYSTSGTLEISHMDSDFKMKYMGYGRRDAVRMFKKDLEGSMQNV